MTLFTDAHRGIIDGTTRLADKIRRTIDGNERNPRKTAGKHDSINGTTENPEGDLVIHIVIGNGYIATEAQNETTTGSYNTGETHTDQLIVAMSTVADPMDTDRRTRVEHRWGIVSHGTARGADTQHAVRLDR